MLTKREERTLRYYNSHATQWLKVRSPRHESFWKQDIAKFHQLLPKGKLLEIGSGGGKEAAEFLRLGYEYTGTDISLGLITQARKLNPDGNFIQKSIYELDFPKESFDGFWTCATLLHIPKTRIREALQNIRREIKIGGIGFISLKEGEGETVEKETGRLFVYYKTDEFSKILIDNNFMLLECNKKFNDKTGIKWLTFFVKKN